MHYYYPSAQYFVNQCLYTPITGVLTPPRRRLTKSLFFIAGRFRRHFYFSALNFCNSFRTYTDTLGGEQTLFIFFLSNSAAPPTFIVINIIIVIGKLFKRINDEPYAV